MAQQSHLAFAVSQAAYVESQVQMVEHGDIQFPKFVPVSTEADEWADSVVFFSMDGAGRAEVLSEGAQNMPIVSITRDMGSRVVHEIGIGYEWNQAEVARAANGGRNLSMDKALYARRAALELLDKICLRAQDHNDEAINDYEGLYNNSAVNRAEVQGANAAARLWTAKEAEDILEDINQALGATFHNTLEQRPANCVLIPSTQFAMIAGMPRSENSDVTVLQYIREANVYTAETGQQLEIFSARGLENAGASGTARMIAYHKDPDVLKFHLPMPHRFYPVRDRDALGFLVPGLARTAGLEMRRPSAVVYRDGI